MRSIRALLGQAWLGDPGSKERLAGDLAAALAALRVAIIDPVADLLEPGIPVYISPYRDLAFVPFGLIPDATGSPLLEAHPLCIVPSLKHLHGIRARGAWAMDSSSRARARRPSARPGREPVRAAARSATKRRKRTSSSLAAGLPASSVRAGPRYRRDGDPAGRGACESRLAHVACHAETRDPVATSRLYLAPGGGRDGVVTAYELGEIPLHDPLVFLSACETGGGRPTADGVLGLAQTILDAGARVVVASQWRVSDAATRVLVGHFYDHFLDHPGVPHRSARLQRRWRRRLARRS